jgi:hypothetical protein
MKRPGIDGVFDDAAGQGATVIGGIRNCPESAAPANGCRPRSFDEKMLFQTARNIFDSRGIRSQGGVKLLLE